MNQFLYYTFIIILYILSAFSFVLIPYSIIKLKRRTSKYIYISKFFVYFGYFCITMFLFIFVVAIHFNGINYKSNNILYLIITVLILALLGIVQLWMWIHYEIHIQDDKFIYSNLFYGKSIIEFSQIDINNSRYLFVFPKGKRDYGHELLKLKMKNGEEYTFKLDMLVQGGDSLLMTNTIIFKLKIKREKVYN